jgi:hypothetical protein
VLGVCATQRAGTEEAPPPGPSEWAGPRGGALEGAGPGTPGLRPVPAEPWGGLSAACVCLPC